MDFGYQWNWETTRDQVYRLGYGIVPNFLNETICEKLRADYEDQTIFRKTVNMERYRFGSGEYKYYKYPLPEIIQKVRTQVYSQLVPVANAWFNDLNVDRQYPDDHATFLKECHQKSQLKPTALLLKYGQGGYNTLHQDLYGDIFFPIQVVLFLSQREEEYTAGEFVLMEQIPRAQSKAIVLNPQKGDMLIFATKFRPVRGKSGYYRVNMKHGVSEVQSGERYTLGIIFHDASH